MMLSTSMMYVLVAFYLIVALTSAFESNWPRALYWVAAALITTSVLWMQK